MSKYVIQTPESMNSLTEHILQGDEETLQSAKEYLDATMEPITSEEGAQLVWEIWRAMS